jgi:hypothetical protein
LSLIPLLFLLYIIIGLAISMRIAIGPVSVVVVTLLWLPGLIPIALSPFVNWWVNRDLP